MSNRKITDMVALTAPASDDVLPIVDISEAAAADKNKKISIEELFKGVPDGTAAAPSIAFESDDDSGIFLAGTNTVGITTAGTQRVTVDASGNVGIGTTSPSTRFHLTGTDDNFITLDHATRTGSWIIKHSGSNSENLEFQQNNGSTTVRSYLAGRDLHEFHTNGSERLRIDASGNCGIGTSSPGANLHVSSSSDTIARITSADGSGAFLDLGDASDPDGGRIVYDSGSNLALYTASSERLRIDSSGRVGIGTSSMSSYEQSFNNLVIEEQGNAGITIATPPSGSTNFLGQIAFAKGTTGDNLYRGLIRYSHIDDAFSLFTAGLNERLRIDSSGRLLVGTSSSRSNLFATTFSSLFQVESQTTTNAQASLTSTTSGINGANLILCHQRSGSVGGNTIVQNNDQLGLLSFQGADGTNMVPGASIEAFVDGTPGSNDMPGRLVFTTTADGSSSPTERMRITQSGGILLGCTAAPNPGAASTSSGFAINGTGNIGYVTAKIDNGPVGYFRRDGTDGTLFDFRKGSTGVGSISVTSSATAFNTSSDYRLKENVINIADGITRVKQLSPKRFNFIVDADKTVDGFLAHEAQTIVPEAVTGTHNEVDDDGNAVMQGIDQSKLVPLLTAALQEAIAKIETLETKVAALEAG